MPNTGYRSSLHCELRCLTASMERRENAHCKLQHGLRRRVPEQVHSEDLAAVLAIVMAHQAPALKSALVLRLLSALVLPDPEHYRALLRRLAALEGALTTETLEVIKYGTTQTLDVINNGTTQASIVQHQASSCSCRIPNRVSYAAKFGEQMDSAQA